MSVSDKLGTRRYEGGIAFEIVSSGGDEAVSKMPVTESMLNPFGTVHAGALIWFADITATVCAIGDPSSVDAGGKGFPLAVDLHCVLLANQRDGELTATSRIVRRGGKLVVVRTEVTGAEGRLLIDMTTTHLRAG